MGRWTLGWGEWLCWHWGQGMKARGKETSWEREKQAPWYRGFGIRDPASWKVTSRDQPRRPANTPLTLGTTVNHSASTRHLYCDGLLKYLPKGSCGHEAINISQRLGDIIPDSLPSVPRLMKSLQQGTSPGRAGWAAPNVFDLLLWGFSLSLWGWGAGVNSFHLEKVYLPPWLTYFRVSGGRTMMLCK